MEKESFTSGFHNYFAAQVFKAKFKGIQDLPHTDVFTMSVAWGAFNSLPQGIFNT